MMHLSLFSGIGGLDLAAEWAGFTTVGQCEFADYQHDVLKQHWPDVPKWRDVKTLTGDDFYAKTGLRTVDVISGGFPCQPFSVAGQHKGKEDDRYLWPEMCRVIRELKPRFVVGENVPGILRIAAADVIADLEREGYRCAIFDYEAAAVGAHHRRERVFFVADNANRNYGHKGRAKVCSNVSDTESWREQREQRIREKARRLSSRCGWSVEPNVGRVAYGIPKRMDRLRCLGNAVVPAQAYPIFAAIADVIMTEQWAGEARGGRMNNDLISRSALQSVFEKECVGECECCVYDTRNTEGCGLINDIVPVDAEVVRHGRWKNGINRPFTYLHLCSVCGKEAYFCGNGCNYKYCPNCGAKMDAEVQDD